MKNSPTRIYLQVGPNCPQDVDFKELEGVSWSDKPVFKNDLTYVRIEDIRNQLTPFKNLLALIEAGELKGTVKTAMLIKDQLNECEKSIKFLTNETLPNSL